MHSPRNKVFGIPNAIGDTGIIFEGFSNIQKVIDFLKDDKIKHGLKARERIIKKFSKNRREAQFKSFKTVYLWVNLLPYYHTQIQIT